MLTFHNEREVLAKIVYYGPALCGKTTNLEKVFYDLDPDQKISQEIEVVNTQGDNTLSYEFMSMESGNVLRIGNYKVKLSLYTVPGQVHHIATRKLVLQDADGIVFVADSQRSQRQLNIIALAELKTNLAEQGLSEKPILMQFNKQDLPGAMPSSELIADLLTTRNEPFLLASAIRGEGVQDTLKLITQMTIDHAKTT
jgi:signal recognition particle receptor subunit beta